MTHLRLRFPPSKIPPYAGRYDAASDEVVEEIAARVRRRGFYERDEFREVCAWKTGRSRSRCAKNSAESIREITRIALSTELEHLRIGVLTLLDGVQWPTASVLLHFGHREPYPILDFRALWSLGVDRQPSGYDFAFWWRYTEFTRKLAAKRGVSMRTLDRALWQFSKENQRLR